MNRVLTIFLLVCVANGAQASLADKLKRNTKLPVHFDGLGEFLTKKVASADSAANLEAIKANIGSLKGGVERAAEILLTIEKAQQCDEQLLSLLAEAERYDLRPSGNQRVWLVIRPHLKRVLELCTDDVEYQVKKNYKQLIAGNETMSKFVDVFSANNANAVDKEGDIPVGLYRILLGHTNEVVSLETLASFAKELAKEDPLLVVKEVTEIEWLGKQSVWHHFAKDKFHDAFEKHLREPCQLLRSSVGRFFDAAITLANIRADSYQFLTERSPQFRSIAWRNNACRFVLSLDQHQLASMQSVNLAKPKKSESPWAQSTTCGAKAD